jgi:hypothetical protein
MILESPSNARSYGTRTPHNVTLTRTSGVLKGGEGGGEFVTPISYIEKLGLAHIELVIYKDSHEC